ncbi:YfjI family protein [Hymenobacter sp. 15J16-1T3B]|uniref:YfjI family protein n=1 Tax=Hymenobacter sp. 15J16-1T3B TaxID=2886941 RepID=UPI0021D44678|nr:YfjI family protein [Hymenobacter sp. 15J16-1T3B]
MLPIWLRKCCEQFSEGAERDVMLLGTLTVLSGCFPTVKGIYDGAPVWLNLFSFVLAPAASGKGALTWARKLAWPWHQQLATASKQANDEYLVQLQEWKASRKGKHANSAPPPPAPPFRQLYIPANNTAAALMNALADNDGRGIICETEADTLSGALGQDFGNFSDLLRKAFHHEPLSLMRKTDREQIDITSPAISLALTGTPAQLRRLIPTAEDGLFSRFLFYTFERPAVWRDVSPAGGRGNLGAFFDEQGKAVTRMMAATAASGNSTVELSERGWAMINAAGNAGLVAAEASGSDGAGLVFRLGLTTFRLAGVLALLRCFENGLEPRAVILASDEDVEAAIQITNVCRAHALYLLATLPTAPYVRGKSSSFFQESRPTSPGTGYVGPRQDVPGDRGGNRRAQIDHRQLADKAQSVASRRPLSRKLDSGRLGHSPSALRNAATCFINDHLSFRSRHLS